MGLMPLGAETDSFHLILSGFPPQQQQIKRKKKKKRMWVWDSDINFSYGFLHVGKVLSQIWL